MKRNSSAVVCIPIYKNRLSIFEQVSLAQARKIFKDFDLYFLAPESLSYDYGVLGEGVPTFRFDNRFFVSNLTYSELMLDPYLYNQFSHYDYMLLYQLDAFAFSNRLLEFCKMGYDYIGAPVERYAKDWKAVGCNIGNGGFSLRKIASMIRILEQKEYIYARKPKEWKENRFLSCEDVFFAFCSTMPELNFHVPNFRIAMDFAVEVDLGHAYRKIPIWMPFGCHAWSRIDYWFWKPVIEREGYQLPQPKGTQKIHQRLRRLECYIFKRILREDSKNSSIAIGDFVKFLPSQRHFALWGIGVYGKGALKLCKKTKQSPFACFDRDATMKSETELTATIFPDIKKIRQKHLFIIVTALRYEDEICSELLEDGFGEENDFIRISEVMHQMFRTYIRSFHK